ncbi:hypothetical protein BGZ79_007946 [Entomortierella chlamydospora]|nr:hypothetical protein BGZ79_007946 [Entomortierella chlamydospora]
MSTFDGLIREFPTVAIDNFKPRPGVSIYLLSHVHSDHLAGLATKTWDSSIYCSQITAKWLPMLATRAQQTAFESGQEKVLQCKYAHLSPFLKPLATDVPHYLDLGNGRQARLSLIPAHHCPGAVMFLLQDDQSCILYTGDARNEALDLQGLSTMSIFSSTTQRIDRLYLDTTYCHQEFQTFPNREFVVSDLITFINRRPRLAHYYIDAWTFGYEDVWIGLSKAFNTKIHVSRYFYELYKAIDDMISPRILPYLTLDGTTARFHSCRLGPTCGYGGAGGEHSSARELIRIQPNVIWFSEMQRAARKSQCETNMMTSRESVAAQRKATQKRHLFKTKEKLPPSIAKKDNLCYYINYSFHASLQELRQLVKIVSPRTLFPCVLHRDGIFNTLYKSNREVVALLAQDMSEISFSLDVEEYKDRRPCISDGITTDFQSFYNAKGFNILDMDDRVLGVDSTTAGSVCQRSSEKGSSIIVLDNQSTSNPTATKVLNVALSPRSNHLRRKMEKLKRQLRSTASLEGQEGVQNEDEESVLEEGPLSLDLEAIEKKRKWWLEYERGKSTTLEENTTGEDETDLQISRILSGELADSIIHAQAVADEGHPRDGNDNQSAPQANEEWNELSTLELNPPSAALVEIEESNIHIQPESRSEVDPNSIYLSSSPDPIYSSKPTEPLYSDPTVNHGSSSAASMPSPDHSVHSPASPALSQTNSVIEAAIASKESAAASLPSPRTQTPVNTECISISSDTSFSLSAASPPHNVFSSLPPLPKTPPRPKDVEIDPGASPSSSCRPNAMRFEPPFDIQRPTGNIFLQIAWSPPLRPIRKPSHAKTVPHHSIDREFKRVVPSTKRASSTIVVDEEGGKKVIVIESSDEDDDISSYNFQDREGRMKKKMKEIQGLEAFQMDKNASSLGDDSQDVNLLEYQELEFDGSNSFVL